eukprot:6177236-Pleurochrysis_carterae.AAC.1
MVHLRLDVAVPQTWRLETLLRPFERHCEASAASPAPSLRSASSQDAPGVSHASERVLRLPFARSSSLASPGCVLKATSSPAL